MELIHLLQQPLTAQQSSFKPPEISLDSPVCTYINSEDDSLVKYINHYMNYSQQNHYFVKFMNQLHQLFTLLQKKVTENIKGITDTYNPTQR